MCGIVGYIGEKDVTSVILVALERLEYRGYDSCGIATVDQGCLRVKKVAGRLERLKRALKLRPLGGKVGIGHTRWATHGPATFRNAHPLVDCTRSIALVHNGIIENHQELRAELKSQGHRFVSETDTEVAVHLIESLYQSSLLDAVRRASHRLKGSFALAVVSKREPGLLVGVRRGSPLIVGLGRDENILASDQLALVGLARRMVVLEEGELCLLERDRVYIYKSDGREVRPSPQPLEVRPRAISKGGFPDYMSKEIYEQPERIRQILSKRIVDGEILLGPHFHLYPVEIAALSRIVIQGCGTSYHAGLVGRWYLERFAKVATQVEIASEFRAREMVLDGKPLILGISQSGETADTLTALRDAKAHSLRVLSILNSQRSSMDRESDDALYIHAGPEIGVASTKAYTAQLITLLLLALYLGRIRGNLPPQGLSKILAELAQLPDKLKRVLRLDRQIKEVARGLYRARHMVFVGRGINYPSALEGALKLKEISYIHAVGYPAGELKHGPISLVDRATPVVCIAPRGSTYEKMLSNIAEVKSRNGRLILLGTEGDERLKLLGGAQFYIPDAPEYLSPILVAPILQLLAYHVAKARGCDVDKPRNLAKSVTVE